MYLRFAERIQVSEATPESKRFPSVHVWNQAPGASHGERVAELPGALGLKTKLQVWVQLAARWETWKKNGGFMSSVGGWQSSRLHQKQGTKLKWRLRDRQEFSAHWSYIDTSTCMHTCIGRQTHMQTHTHRHQMTGWWNHATGSAKCLTLCRVQVRKLCAFYGLVCLLAF